MKSLLKVLCAALMLTLASCAHHKGAACHEDKCKMEKGSKECQECCKSGKCDMSKEAAPATSEVKAEEVKTEAPAATTEAKPAAKKEKKKAKK